MIAKCRCGNIKTVHPFMNAGEVNWVCDSCSYEHRKKFRENKERKEDEERVGFE